MKKKILSGILSLAMLGSLITLPTTGVSAAEDYSDYATWEVTAQNRIKTAHDYHLGNTYGTGMGGHPRDQAKDGWAQYIYDESKLTMGGVGINGTQNAGRNMALPNSYYNWIEWKPETNYVVKVTLRNMSEGDVTPTFYVGMLSHNGSNFVDVKYEKVMITEKGTTGQQYTNTFTTGASASGITGVYMGFGTGETVGGVTTEKTATGSIVGAKGSSLYIGEEQVKEITNETKESTNMYVGDSITAKSQVLNQVGDTGLLDQTISFKVLNADRTEEVLDSGITVTPGTNGNYTISVAEDATVGEYVILAKSALSQEGKLLQKGLKIKVSNPYAPVDYTDFVKKDDSELPLNMIKAVDAEHYMGKYGISPIDYVAGEGMQFTYETKNLVVSQAINGSRFPRQDYEASKFNWTQLEKDSDYIVSFRMKNVSAEGITPKFGVQMRADDGTNSIRVWDIVDVTEREDWQEYSEVLHTDVEGSSTTFFLVGFPTGGTNGKVDGVDVPKTPDGSVVMVDIESLSFVKAVAWDIAVDSKDEIPAGEVLEAEASILNQFGGKIGSKQSFKWYLLDPETNKPVKGVTVTPNASDSSKATVTLKDTVEPGEYVLLAKSETYPGFDRAKNILVTKPIIKDSEPISSTLHEVKVDIKGEGSAEMGLFDELTLKAEMVDNAGNVGSNVQAFSWIATNEKRTEEESKIKIEVSQDTTEATIKLEPSIESGKYYIIAESTAEESKGMKKGFAITVDKSGAVKEIADGFKVNTPENITKLEENIDTYLEVLKLNDADDLAKKTDKKDLVALIVASSESETLETEADVQKFVEKLAVVSLYNKNENGVSLYAIDGNFQYADELALTDIDKDGVTLYKLYRTTMSDEGRKEMQKVLEKPGTPYASYDDFINAVKENVLLYAIAYPENLGTGYMDDVLTDKNIAAAGFLGGEYTGLSDKEDANYEMARKLYTKAQLQDALDNAEDFGEEEGGGYIGGFSPSPSTGSKPAKDYTDIIGNLTDTAKPQVERTFIDVPTTHWAYSDIYFLKDLGAISGVSATEFKPEGYVTREQFLKIVIDALKISPKSTDIAFKDVVKGSWYEEYVKTGVSAGIINGMSADTFGVGMPITRQDVCVILTRAMQIDTENVSALLFDDGDAVSDYASPSISVLVEYAIINGFEDNTFKPQNPCTRAQSARIIANAVGIINAIESN